MLTFGRQENSSNLKYRAPVYDQSFFRQEFFALEAPIDDKFKIQPVLAEVLELTKPGLSLTRPTH